MIEEMGIVVSAEADHAWIETKVKTTCGSCATNDNCGTGLVAKAFSPKPEHIRIETPSPLRVGQTVKIGIPEQHLLSASLWMYILPLAVLLASASVLQGLSNLAEPLVIVISFVCTFLSYWGVSRHLKSERFKHMYHPVFLGATTDNGVFKKHEIPLKRLE
uniref:SoxR reducing system RseC family protein n=1 Tax=Ningiella ruwaisensis TaxID=2364274 RepID=UPI00109FE990|nr:SoxR reducing system RseC family protein [Ningiella ruwaisensis]